MANFNTASFRASSWGNLLTEPITKTAKEAGELSKTCQSELIKIYNRERYGREYDYRTKQMEKGVMAEPQSIAMFSVVMGEIYEKNHEQFTNEWFSGHPDIIHETGVWDIKTSWNLDTFCPKQVEEPDNSYIAQLNCYYSLTGAQEGGIVYCLADCPPEILAEEKYRLLRSMNVVTEESPEYIKEAIKLEKNLTFPDIDIYEKVIIKKVPRNEELIEKMKAKVPKLRAWLQEFHEKRVGGIKNFVNS